MYSIAEHANGQVRAVKLVYKLSDTNDDVSGSGNSASAPKVESGLKSW
jgi:hypothetical protein